MMSKKPSALAAMILMTTVACAGLVADENKPAASVQEHRLPGGDSELRKPTPEQIAWHEMEIEMFLCLDRLMDIYYKSVGRGCVLLLNATPDTTGRIPESHVRRYEEFGLAIRRIYENKKGEAAGIGRELEIRFDRPTVVNHIVTMEDIRYGQIVRRYAVDGFVDGQWRELLNGSSIGYKRIDVIDTMRVTGLRLRVTAAVDQPVIKRFAAYEAPQHARASVTAASKPAAWRNVTGWEAVALTGRWQTVDIDLTPVVRQPGQYEVEFRQTAGGGALEVRRAVIVMAGAEAPRLITRLDRPLAWNINRTAQVTPDRKGRTVLRVVIRTSGPKLWQGRLRVRRTP